MPNDLLEITAFCAATKLDLQDMKEKTAETIVFNDALHQQRANLPFLMNLCERRLAKIYPASFPFLLEAQIPALEKELLLIQYIYKAQLAIDTGESRFQNKQNLEKKIRYCDEVLNQLLNRQPITEEEIPADVHNRLIADSPGHCRYLGMMIVAPLLVKQLRAIQNAPGKTGTAKSIMREINIKRLYWVFTGSFLASLIAALPAELTNRQKAQNMVAAPSQVAGILSWGLYYTRFAVELGLLLKHTIKGPWMSQEEKNLGLSTYERFKTQWAQRKYMLMNDSLWATANLLCYFWLIGNGNLGYAGNILTGVLFTFDTIVSLWRFAEESTLHNKMIQTLNDEIETIRDQINQNHPLEEMNRLHAELKQLQVDHKHLTREWRYKKYGLINDCAYSIGLIIGIAGMCALFFPPAALLPATMTLLSVVGAGICYAMSLLYTIANGQLELSKERSIGQDALDERLELMAAFKAEPDERIQRQIYLDIQALDAKTLYQERLISYKRMELARTVVTDVIFPAAILISGFMLSTGIGIAVLLSVVALATIIYLIIKQFEPEASNMPEFDEQAFQDFAQEQHNAPEPEIRHGQAHQVGLFHRRVNRAPEDEHAPLIEQTQPAK